MATRKKLTEFKKGHYYHYKVKHTSTPSGWGASMRDVEGKEALLCIYGDGLFAEFAGCKHNDERLTDAEIMDGTSTTRGWLWDDNLENWEEVLSPDTVFGKMKSGLLDRYVKKYCEEDTCATPGKVPLKEADDPDGPDDPTEPEYSFVFPKRSDVRAELLRKLSNV